MTASDNPLIRPADCDYPGEPSILGDRPYTGAQIRWCGHGDGRDGCCRDCGGCYDCDACYCGED